MAPPVPPPPAAAKPHLDVRQWLAVLDLQQYAPNFERFTGVEELLSFSEEDIRSLGVRNSAHRARVVSSLVALRSKYDKGPARIQYLYRMRCHVKLEDGAPFVLDGTRL
ncbi:Uncharacterized protein GBIM_10414 [Gryllus bimaculatus]|nr:Uncharacterized protein GBIM_10414 [Gryllus bimaculatus]